MNNVLIPELKRIFFGALPKELQNLPEDFEAKANAAVEKQDVKSFKQLNYVTFIQDIGENVFGILSKSKNKRQSLLAEELQRAQIINRMVLISKYEQIMQGDDYPIIKVETAYFYRNLIVTATKIYGVDIITNQALFIEQSLKDEERFQALEEDFWKLIAEIQKPEEFYPHWKYSTEQLHLLSEHLLSAGYISDTEDFINQFLDKSERKCKWNKRITSLVYLFEALFPDEEELLPEKYFAFIATRFTQKDDKEITKRVAENTYYRIEGKSGDKQGTLKGEFSELQKIHHLIFVSTKS